MLEIVERELLRRAYISQLVCQHLLVVFRVHSKITEQSSVVFRTHAMITEIPYSQ